MSNEFKLVPTQPTDAMVRAGMGIGDDNCLYWRHPQQAYVDMLAAAPQPPALGGEPETLAWLVRDSRDGQYSAHRHNPTGWAHGYDVSELIDRAHIATLQAEIERLKNIDHRQMLAESAAKYLLDSGAENFVGDVFTIEADDGVTKFEILVTTQRVGGKSPGEVCSELKAENDQLKARCDELKILLACRDDDMKSVSVEFDGIAGLLRCALPFVQARCDETDYGDASARTTREGILNVLKRLYKPAGSEQV